MCESMETSNLQRLRLGKEKKKIERKKKKEKKKPQDENIMSTSSMQGGHKK